MNERLIDRYWKVNISEADMYLSIQNIADINGQPIEITYRQSNLGQGEIPFFVCPDCNKARRDMYFKDGVWSCYRCHDLVYYSQQRSRNTYRYWINRAEKEARKIDPDFKITGLNDLFNHNLIFSNPKPKFMQWRKYESIYFWYDMYIFRAGEELYSLMAPTRRFIDMTKKNAPVVEKQLQDLIKKQKNSGN